MEIPGKMQVTLVTHYGEKAGNLLELIRLCQDKLSELLLSAFRPYELEQAHGTIIGLEGCRVENQIKNGNFLNHGGQTRFMAPEELLAFLRSSEIPLLNVRIGGYRHDKEWGFLSRNKHPYLRSFSIQGPIAVAMGWPVNGETFPNTLDKLRRRFNEVNVLHSWHRKETDIDNDFFFVLGRVDRRFVDETRLQQVEEEMRLLFAGLSNVTIPIHQGVLSLVGYLDTQLPVPTSCSFRIDNPELDTERLLNLYPVCET